MNEKIKVFISYGIELPETFLKNKSVHIEKLYLDFGGSFSGSWEQFCIYMEKETLMKGLLAGHIIDRHENCIVSIDKDGWHTVHYMGLKDKGYTEAVKTEPMPFYEFKKNIEIDIIYAYC